MADNYIMYLSDKDMPNQGQLFLGIDGGATKCRVSLENDRGQVLSTGLGGSANPSHGMENLVSSVITATDIALAEAGLRSEDKSRLIVGAGFAGLHLRQYRQLVEEWRHPFAELYLTDDLHIACIGAHGHHDGAVIIAGTGFSAAAVIRGETHQVGGFGFLMADYCSGSWLGYQAVQQVLLADDGLAEPTGLSAALQARFHVQGADLANVLLGAAPRDYAALAPLVFSAADQGDIVAMGILQDGADFITAVARNLRDRGAQRLALVGSIAQALRSRLCPDVLNGLVEGTCEPEQGAVQFAMKCYQQKESIK